MSSYIVSFPSSNKSYQGSLGGKGTNLLRLSNAGLPVPPGIIVSSSAYRAWSNSCLQLPQLIKNLSYHDITQLEKQSEEIRHILELHPIPLDLQENIASALNNSIDTHAFAVRSSSTFEDLADAAFAGQHDTYLNCNGLISIFENIKKCWCSLWTSRAVLYRHAHKFDQNIADMAVVVQQQIACDVAGVAFSMQPVSGDLAIVSIDANYGLGESVVAGEFPVDHIEIEKDTFEVSLELIAEKTHAIVMAEEGTKVQALKSEQQSKSCLSLQDSRRVAQLAIHAERFFGWPQDTEWGISNGELYLLQSRPITRIPERWTRDESAERFPKPSTPLSWDYMYPAFQRSLRFSLPALGLPTFEGDWFQKQGHFIYGNQTVVQILTRFMPINSVTLQDLENEIEIIRARYQWVLDFSARWMRDLDLYLLKLGKLAAINLNDKSEIEILAYLDELAEVAADYFEPNIVISMGQGFLYKSLFQIVVLIVGKERALTLFDGLLAGLPTKTTQVNQELYFLAQEVSKNTELHAILKEVIAVGEQPSNYFEKFPNFKHNFELFLAHHGHRELFLDYYYPTWCDAQKVVVSMIALIAKDSAAKDPSENLREGRIKFLESESALILETPSSLHFFVRELIRLAREFTALDDLEHYQTTRVNPFARRAALILADKLCSQGKLEDRMHIFFLHRTELLQLVSNASNEFSGLAAKRAADYLEADANGAEWIFGENSEPDAVDADCLNGIPGSPGVITAPCYIIDEVSDFENFPKGAILVARTTNPAWTPVFYLASAVVTESGGPLSHGAVTAREMRLPAVMGVRGIMKKIKSGDILSVNGSKGVITITKNILNN